MNALYELRYRVQTYPWGSHTFLARLTGRNGRSSEPEAELWLGTHPAGPSEVVLAEDGVIPLGAFLARDPRRWLGSSGALQGDELPFLLKLLAVERPLSLQAHPDARAARKGFEREERLGLAASERSYRDAHHKPELVVALEPFYALRGLRQGRVIRRLLEVFESAELAECLDELGSGSTAGLRSFLSALLAMPAEVWRSCVRRVQPIVRQRAETGDSGDPYFWVDRLLTQHPDDPACLAPLFLHLVRLEPGQGLFQSPGTLHCYLEGAAVEAMAASDNVLRGGLTTKRIDLPELLSVVRIHPEPVRIVEAACYGSGVESWSCPAEEFSLLRLRARAGAPAVWPGEGGLAVCICTAGRGELRALGTQEREAVSGGRALLVAPDAGGLCLEGEAEVWCAAVPQTVN